MFGIEHWTIFKLINIKYFLLLQICQEPRIPESRPKTGVPRGPHQGGRQCDADYRLHTADTRPTQGQAHEQAAANGKLDIVSSLWP